MLSNFFLLLPFTITVFLVYSISLLLFYFFVMKKTFINKMPLVSSKNNNNNIDIYLLEEENKEKNICGFYYKGYTLSQFDSLHDYVDFCKFLESYICIIIKDYEFAKINELDLFFTHIGIQQYKKIFETSCNWHWPGLIDRRNKYYDDLYGLFSKEYLRFLIIYNQNKNLFLSLNFFWLSIKIRGDAVLVFNNEEEGIHYLDLYYNIFIRNKFDILQLWYALNHFYDFISKKNNLLLLANGTSENFLVLNQLFKNLTMQIMIDFEKDLTLFQKLVLLFALFKIQVRDFSNQHLKSIYIYIENMNRNIKNDVILNFIKLIPITLLLYFVYNTVFTNYASYILFLYILFLSLKNSFKYIHNIIHISYKNKYLDDKVFIWEVFFKKIYLLLYGLFILTISIYILSFFSYKDFSFTFLCFYLAYIIKYAFSKINKKK